MSEKILVPILGESITEATVSKWLKNQGESIQVDEPIVELETDKVNLEVPSPISGILSKINAKNGETVEVGAVLGLIDENGNKSIEPKKFSIDSFIQKQNIGFLLSSKPIKIDVKFDSLAGFHLTETPISEDQELVQEPDGSYRLKATLADTSQLRWWLLGFGDQVEVIRPKFLRDEFRATTIKLYKLYNFFY